jgi:hypothetical protein
MGRRGVGPERGGEGRPRKGEGSGGQERGMGGHLGFFCGRKETTHQMTSDLASNGPQPFSHIHAPKVNFWSCDILAPGMGCPGPRLNRINSVIILTRCIFFFGSLSQKNLQVKRAWLGAIWDG